jgi:hypothetical protein
MPRAGVAKQLGGRRKDRRGERTQVRDSSRPTEDSEMRRATHALGHHQTVESRFSISSIGFV